MEVKTEEQYEEALKMIERIMACTPPDKENSFLLMLAKSVKEYELEHYPMNPPVWE